ncbi:hypothetical protein ABT236_20730 [Streptomyces sp. NPDC001523]|uniref:hypothetical protein n=1 Tax=Streptomyces sp. NPDC001523 TaxID=3154383 RepID=UPI00331E4D89
MQDLRHQLIEGRADVPRIGSVIKLDTIPWYAVVGPDETLVAPVVPYLRGLILDDNRPLTAKSYAYDLLRWHRLLWFLEVPWDRATEAEASALVGWLRIAPNPQRRRSKGRRDVRPSCSTGEDAVSSASTRPQRG